MKKTIIYILLSMNIFVVYAQDIPLKISYQGKLLENNQPVTDTKSMTFTIDSWSETQNVEIIDGLYSIVLGSINPIPLSLFENSSTIELQISVEGTNLSPSTEILSVAYAFISKKSYDTDKIAGNPVSGNPQDGNVLKWNGSQWIPSQDLIGDGIETINSGTGINVQNPSGPTSTISISDNGVGNAQLSNNSINSEKIQDGSISISDLNFTPIINPYNNLLTVQKLEIGNPVNNPGDGSIVVENDILIEEELEIFGGIEVGNPSSSAGNGEIVAKYDIISEEDIVAGEDLFVGMDANIDGDLEVLGEADFNTFSGFHESALLGSMINIKDEKTGPLGVSMGLLDNDLRIETHNNYNRVLIESDFSVTGSKNATVFTKNYGQRKTYCDESTEVFFFDRGQSKLINGVITIDLDPIFLETVTLNKNNKMLIQITPTSDCNGIFVSEKYNTNFTVKELMNGTSNATFDWEVAAKRKGYENIRLEKDNYILKEEN